MSAQQCLFILQGSQQGSSYLWGGQHRDPDKDSGWEWRLHHHPRDAPAFSEWGTAQKCEKDRGRLPVVEAHINLYQRGFHPWAYAEYPCRYPQNVYSGRDDGRRHQKIWHQAVGLGVKKPRCVSHQGFKMILFVMKYNHSGWLRHKSMATFVLWGMMGHSLIFFKHIVELAYLSRDLHQYFL